MVNTLLVGFVVYWGLLIMYRCKLASKRGSPWLLILALILLFVIGWPVSGEGVAWFVYF